MKRKIQFAVLCLAVFAALYFSDTDSTFLVNTAWNAIPGSPKLSEEQLKHAWFPTPKRY